MIPRGEEKNYHSVSSAQSRLYFLQNMDKSSIIYNLPIIAEIKGPFDKKRMEAALSALVQRHESLRTSFSIREGALVQIVNEHIDVNIVDFVCDARTQEMEACVQKLVTCFDLAKAPLVRVFLAQRDPEHHVVLFDFHHSIFDGFSLDIFFNNLLALYHHEELPELRIQYKDYAEYQNSKEMKEVRRKQEQYWIDQFEEPLPVLHLPQDYRGDGEVRNEANVVQTTIDAKMLINLKECAQRNETTLFTMMLVSCYLVLAKSVVKRISSLAFPQMAEYIEMWIRLSVCL